MTGKMLQSLPVRGLVINRSRESRITAQTAERD
jgi:hypothetical protein